MVVCAFANSQLIFKILKRIKTMRSIKFFIVFSVAALDLSIMPGCIWFDQFMLNSQSFQFSFKGSGCIITSGQKAFCEFCAVICLYTLDRIGEPFYHMLEKQL